MKRVLVLTALPFKRRGNQSLLRFVGLFLSRGIHVDMYTSGSDAGGHHRIEDSTFTLHEVFALRDHVFDALRRLARKRRARRPRPSAEPPGAYYRRIRSEDVVPPYGAHNWRTALRKWSYFLLLLIDNLLLTLRFLILERAAIRRADLVVGYECDYAFAARFLARAFRKRYVNKFQGTVLKATGRDRSVARRYYPNAWFGLNRADLCLMVDDGTDGEYYAKVRGNRKIFCEPHGVALGDYSEPLPPLEDPEFSRRALVFNNASASTWKRIDRILRALARVSPEARERMLFVTTYHADDVDELKAFARDLGLEDCVRFVDRLDHIQSNVLLRHARALVMTNDMSNLGNPVLEAIHYRVPVISINDGSLDGYVTDGVDGMLLDLDDHLDEALARVLEKVVLEDGFAERLRQNRQPNPKVNPLEVQQAREFEVIEAVAASRPAR